ncbi:MAG: Flp pilus assembly complex ATPase component TadA [Verrucomicrobia bacterium]|nr:Flp pilus assembly complex ATPase component TadA [Verrucomicrobiota bacterium]MCG2680512.1 Flp pilus assembly complex ATPase component TadA [Kiritimatiellia bacterium]MBU4248235.1 Flp pilus assembly complex ATPase component TadA [Verrucomicrobiota bacterium]MBU4290438.1 Flp pilus assembly complex ATPase component TadA [Verrucomicrobiota bacterium]MBU4428852.1 Flp pilus assembly complex ATPase component TadA [Verrucomicrobiota bacterium]
MNNSDNKELNRIYHTLGSLFHAGVAVLHALKIVREQTHDTKMQQVLDGFIKDIAAGDSFHESAAKFPDVFSAAVLAKIKAGEAMGTIDATFLELADASGSANAKDAEAEDPDSAGVIKFVNLILYAAVRDKASDIHFECSHEKKLRIRYRIDGALRELSSPSPGRIPELIIERIKLMANMNPKETRLPQDGRIQMSIEGKDIDLRVSVSPYTSGESAVLRVLDHANLIIKLDQICESPETLGKLRSWIKRPNGLIIATGTTGSGKTTLLYALLQELNSPDVKITTIEDPVEYIIDGVNQQQVRCDIGLTFARALRSQLRQAPNIMMIGETRDLETAQIMIQAAITGHLVLTTLHTQDAPEAIRRLLDIGIEPFLVNSTLTGVIAQRLVRCICQKCKEEYQPESWVLDLMGANQPAKFFRGKGCEQCHQTGYRGRMAIHELLEIDDPMRKLINHDAGLDELRRQALASGMVTLKADGLAKVSQGLTTVEEVLRYCL